MTVYERLDALAVLDDPRTERLDHLAPENAWTLPVVRLARQRPDGRIVALSATRADDYAVSEQDDMTLGLLWQRRPRGAPQPQANAAALQLNRFLALRTAPPSDILAFARQFGVLGICEHGHTGASGCGQCAVRPAGSPYVIVDSFHWEPLDAWRQTARAVDALLHLVAALVSGDEPARADFLAVAYTLCDEPADELRGLPGGPAGDWELVTLTVNEWLRSGSVRPAVVFDGDGYPSITYVGGGLYGALGVQLLLHAARGKGLKNCRNCGNGYVPSRQSQKYCDAYECRKQAAWRQGRRNQREGTSKPRRRGRKAAGSLDNHIATI